MNNLPIFAFGANPSDIDVQAVYAHQMLDMAPMVAPSYKIEYFHPHFNQKDVGVCTAADLVDMAEKIWGIKFSCDFTYWGGKAYDGNLVEGSSNLSMLRHGKNVGFLPAAMDPGCNNMDGGYQGFLGRRKIYTQAQINAASQYKLTGYGLVSLDPVGFATALQNSKYGLLTRMAVGNNFYSPSWFKSDLELLKAPVPITGGHSIKVIEHVGLDSHQIRTMRNSWGDKDNPTIAPGLQIWSDNGDLKYDYSTQAPYVTEAYMVSADPVTFKHKFTSSIFFGTSSSEVTALQRVLVQLGFLLMPAGVKYGYYGPLTRQAVLNFQITKNIVPNNGGQSVGPRTMAALNLAQGL